MRRFDVCNGDADGLCALRQWRLHEPAQATLLTGLKREIALLGHVPATAGDEVCVFDLSMQRNLVALRRLLASGVRVRYFDHHAVDAPPQHRLLDAQLDTAPDVCTSLLVDRAIGGAHRAWALVGAYGDNLAPVADRLADEAGVGAADRVRLRRLGEAINYNAYGDDERDLCIAPSALYALLSRYRDPRRLLDAERIADDIDALRRADLAQAGAVAPHWQGDGGSVHRLPDAPWAARVLGAFANELANAAPARAHAVARAQRDGRYAVSVRAPLVAPDGADALCRRFGGGGRAGAGGIDGLAADALDDFVAAFASMRWGRGGAVAGAEAGTASAGAADDGAGGADGAC